MILFYSGNLGDRCFPEEHHGLSVMLTYWEISGRAHAISSNRAKKRMKMQVKRRRHGRTSRRNGRA